MLKGSIGKIETLGLLDGPGVRIVIFLNGCNKRCLYCHNPEMFKVNELNYTVNSLVNTILKYKNYIINNGGVTFSGGEPLLQSKFLISVIKQLKKEDIHIAIDTAGYNSKESYEVLRLSDLILLDIKEIDSDKYLKLTNSSMIEFNKFIKFLNTINKDIWIRQVIIPGYNDNYLYIDNLSNYLKQINNIKKIELLPYHSMAINKYKELNLNYEFSNVKDMSIDAINDLNNYLKTRYLDKENI